MSDARMAWFAAPDGRPGRQQRFSDQAAEFGVTLKGRFQLPLRQVMCEGKWKTRQGGTASDVNGVCQTLPDFLAQNREEETILSEGGDGANQVIPVRRSGCVEHTPCHALHA